jgi:hypothetical protein
MKISRNREIQQYLISINERIVKRLVKIQSARLARMVAALSLRRDVKDYAHWKEDDYNEALKAFL